MFDLIKIIHRCILVPNTWLRYGPDCLTGQYYTVCINALNCVIRSLVTCYYGNILEHDPPLDEERSWPHDWMMNLTMFVMMVLVML